MKNLFLIASILFFAGGLSTKAQTLQPGDGIKILFYNISDQISGDYYIQEDGTVRLPFLGRIDAVNRDIKSLKEEVYQKYSKLYVNPELTVLALMKVNILGEVRNPGFYYVTGIDKLSDLLAKAGGSNVDASLGDIKIIRNEQETEIDGNKVIENGSKLDDIGLRSGDRVFISRKWLSGSNTTIIISIVSAITSLAVAVIYSTRK